MSEYFGKAHDAHCPKCHHRFFVYSHPSKVVQEATCPGCFKDLLVRELPNWAGFEVSTIETVDSPRGDELEQENKRLRTALEKIVNLSWNEILHHENAHGIARRALEEEKE